MRKLKQRTIKLQICVASKTSVPPFARFPFDHPLTDRVCVLESSSLRKRISMATVKKQENADANAASKTRCDYGLRCCTEFFSSLPAGYASPKYLLISNTVFYLPSCCSAILSHVILFILLFSPQGYVIVPSDSRFLLLFTFLKKNKDKKVMVFFSSCNSVKYHSELLNYIDLPVLDIHVSHVYFLTTMMLCGVCAGGGGGGG